MGISLSLDRNILAYIRKWMIGGLKDRSLQFLIHWPKLYDLQRHIIFREGLNRNRSKSPWQQLCGREFPL